MSKGGYDVTEPHKVLVGKGRTNLVVQNGQVYERGSHKHIGPASTIMNDPQHEKLGYKTCKVCHGTQTSVALLEEHIFKTHREQLIAEAQKSAPKNIKGVWSPTEDMLQEEAAKLAGSDKTAPEPEAGPEEKAETAPKKKATWREKAK